MAAVVPVLTKCISADFCTENSLFLLKTEFPQKTTSAPMIRTETDQPRPGNAPLYSMLKQKGVRDGKRLPNTPTGSSIPQYMCSIMVLEALEALHGLITQSNDLTVKCWAGIRQINAQVPALKVLTLGEVRSTPASCLPIKPPLNYWLQNLSEDARGKNHSKGFLKIIIFFLNTRCEALSCLIHDSLKKDLPS